MKLPIVFLTASMMAVPFAPAMAEGCLAGAAAGGIAGHYGHHTLSGLIGGCLTGRVLAADYRRYKEEHPNSHLSFTEFVKQQKDRAQEMIGGGGNDNPPPNQ